MIQSPSDTQSLNRYSYVINNPLNATDPSGFNFIKQYIGAIVAVVLTIVFPPAGFLAAALIGGISGAIGAAVNGGNILKGALVGALSGAAFFGIGEYFQGLEALNNSQWAGLRNTIESLGGSGAWEGVGLTAGQTAAKVALHGLAGGVGSLLSGGKFGHGFASAGLTQAASRVIGKIDAGNKGVNLQRTVAAGIVGGTVSKLTGGKFANGALTGAWSRIFNDGLHASAKNEEGYDPNFWENPGYHLPSVPQGLMDGVTGFGDGVYWGITLGHGFGQGEGLNWIRGNYLSSGGVNAESGVYKVGFGAGAVEGSLALSGALAVKYAGFRFDSVGRWKNKGVWQEGRHFHLGTGGGLQKHHLPQQFGNWWNNLKGIVKRKWGS